VWFDWSKLVRLREVSKELRGLEGWVVVAWAWDLLGRGWVFLGVTLETVGRWRIRIDHHFPLILLLEWSILGLLEHFGLLRIQRLTITV
jgi:hypothetical protein